MTKDKKLRELLGFESNEHLDWTCMEKRGLSKLNELRRLEKKLNALADHLGLEWQEEHTEPGRWVKKKHDKQR